jgi:hypothetical protein
LRRRKDIKGSFWKKKKSGHQFGKEKIKKVTFWTRKEVNINLEKGTKS